MISEGENVPEIQTLTQRVLFLNQATDWWNAAMIWALIFAALSAVAVVGTTMMALRRAKQAGDAQSELIQAKDLQLTLDLGDKDVKIGQAAKDAADAKGAMAKQQERAAIAERSLLELQERIKDRHLTGEQQMRLSDRLRGFPNGQLEVRCAVGNPESRALAVELMAAFNSNGWHATLNDRVLMTRTPVGLQLWIHTEDPNSREGVAITGEAPERARSILNAFEFAQLSIEGHFSRDVPRGELVLVVGFKP
jgi:hypothetical protein